MPTRLQPTVVEAAVPAREEPETPPFGPNELRLDWRQWLVVAALVLAFVILAPALWKRAEKFTPDPDYRVPYPLSSDYWLYQRRVEETDGASTIPVLGDSVIWGEYVRPDGTLPHFLNGEAGGRARFANCGLNGVFPLAMEGLVAHYAGALHDRKVIVHCNLLWLSSPKADMSAEAEETLNHPGLLPQGYGRVPSYHADAAARLGCVAQRSIPFAAWVAHIDDAYFGQMSVPQWSLREEGSDPRRYPNAWRSPFGALTMRIPGEPAVDPQRGPTSRRHRPWDARGARPVHFDWVPLDRSLQWRAFQRTIRLLRQRRNDVLVVIGPFNEHMVAADQRATYHAMRDGVTAWLAASEVAYVVPQALPSPLYADASHPLTEGYAQLARELYASAGFQDWLNRRPAGR